MADDIEIPESHRVAIEHRLAVMKVGRFTGLLIIVASLYGAFTQQWYLIAIALVSGIAVMTLVSIQSANGVKKLTGLSHTEQAAIWKQYKTMSRLLLNDNDDPP